MELVMEIDVHPPTHGCRPTDAEAWTYIVQHDAPLTYALPSMVQEIIGTALKGKWHPEVVARINVHDFTVIWSDHRRYRKLATGLANGPGAEVFNIETLNKLKQCRLEGYWDSLLENGTEWLETVFTGSPSRVSLKDFNAILACARHSEGSDDYKIILEFSKTDNTIVINPPDTRWDFAEIMREIKEYGTIAKMVMLHVTFWYNPKLDEPYPRKADKKPIYYHLRKPFRKILRRKSHVDGDEDWETKAIALQQVVVDFTKAQNKGFSGRFMIATPKFYQMPKVYHERFEKGKFWDRLAQDIHSKMPEIPSQHSDPLPYNYAGSNIYHSDQRPSLGIASPADSEKDISNIVGLDAEEECVVAPEIEDLIGQEYGSDTSRL